MKVPSRVKSCLLACFLLSGFVACCCEHTNCQHRCGAQDQDSVVIITRPPVNKTVCEGSNVTISCRYQSNITLPVTWIINGTSYSEEEIVNSPIYQLNNPTTPLRYSLTVFFINGTTTFQCTVHSASNTTITSAPGTVTLTNKPVVKATATGGCGSIYVRWSTGSSEMCRVTSSAVVISYRTGYRLTQKNFQTPRSYRFNGVPSDTSFVVTVYVSRTENVTKRDPSDSTYARTKTLQRPNPVRVTARVNYNRYYKRFSISLSWRRSGFTPSCAGEVTQYLINVIDQYRPARVTVTGSWSSEEISYFSGNGTHVIPNTEYIIIVTAISDTRSSYPSDPVVVNTYLLNSCNITSPSVGAIRVSCDTAHEILVTTKRRIYDIKTTSGSSPLTVTGLDPGETYSVAVDVFDGNQVGLTDQTVRKSITVNSVDNGDSDSTSGGISTGATVGTVIGGVAIIIIIVIIIVAIPCFVLYKKKRSALIVDDDNDDKASLQRSPMLLETSKSY